METYEVKIVETLERVIRVKADSKEKAIQQVSEQYANEEIILTADDHISTEFFNMK